MNASSNVSLERIDETDLKLQSQLNKCLNEKRRRQCEIGYLDELAGLITASASDMCSLSVKPDKCAILQETVNQIRRIKLAEERGSTNDLQQSEVSSSKPNILANDILGPLLLEALDGFLFMVNTDGKIEFVSENIKSFLNYTQESLIDKSIYNIIHVGDHARFSSNLLPMSIGNGFGWSSEPNATISKSRSFNCRFLVKPPEDQEETMEEKQTRVSQYENMQIAAVLLPFSGEKSESGDLDSDVQNHLVCVARRIPANEKNGAATVEQFTTRLDLSGKILTIDTSGVTSTYSQYLNKELVGRIIQELCHPNDFQKLNQHLKETLQLGSNTSGVYRLRVAEDKFVHVQTKSKRFNYNPMANEQEFIVATHSIIRDSEQQVVDGNMPVPQRSSSSPTSGTLTTTAVSSVNGTSYPFPSLSPNEFSLNDIGLDIFPSSSWDLGNSDGPEVEATSIPASLGGTTPVSANSAVSNGQRTQSSLGGSAYSSELLSNRGSPSSQSPSHLSSTNSPAQGRATPFTNAFPFSPIQTQPVSRANSPASKRENTVANSELLNLSPIDGLLSDSQDTSVNAKLRNLLTHGIGEADSSVSKNSNSEKSEVDVSGASSDRRSYTPRTTADNTSCRNENIILRELLNQDDEEMNDSEVKSVQNSAHGNLTPKVEMCPNDVMQKKHINNNNMLRKLLNNDEDENYRRDNEPLIQQLLKTEGKNNSDSSGSMSASKAGNGFSSAVVDSMASITKRKSPSTPSEEPSVKRQNTQNSQHAHLAGQNPMLASMLAQTPRTAPSVPTSVANAIVSQLPQERLPKNLEKKLVHTPYTGAASSTNASQYSYSQVQGTTRSLLSTSLQQEIVTADSRGHVTLAPQSTSTMSYQPNQGFLNKMLPTLDTSNIGQTQGMQSSISQFQQNRSQQSTNSTTMMFSDLNIDAMAAGSSTQASDPLLSEILEQVWSMEQDMNMDSSASDDLALYKLLEDNNMPEPPPPVAATSPQPPQDVNEKMAITAIQRQLMSYEIPNAVGVVRSSSNFSQSPPLPVAGVQSQMAPNTFSQVSHHYQGAPPAYSASSAGQRMRNPGLHPGQPPPVVPTAQQMVQARQSLPQYNLTSVNVSDLTPQMRRNLLERRQKVYLHTQHKRMLLQQQQQKQQLTSRQQAIPESPQVAVNNPFPDNMGDLMNNSVAPNVTLQRSASIPESQLSPRYAAMTQMPNSAGPPQSPSQLSPGQRQQPFSPMSQQPFSGNYPQSRLSPHMSSQPGPNQSWVQRASQNQANIQQQNPMLNAQLSQGAFNSQVQSRFPNQQQQPRQMVVRSMPSPGSRNSPFSNPPDSPFHPPSPGVALYQQQQQPSPAVPQQPQQQRLQRAVPIPSRVNSPRALQAGYGGGEPALLSPQPSPGNYNSPASNYSPASSASVYNTDAFGYEQQVYPSAAMDRSRGGGGAMTSEYVRQEIRAMVGARTQQQQQQQQQHQAQQQQLLQQMPQSSQNSSQQSLSQADFDALGFSLDLPSDNQQTSSLFSQSLLSVGGCGDNHNQPPTGSPRFQAEEVRPAEPKKSLLQQLLSEPP